MSMTVRPATLQDVDAMATLLVEDAAGRQTVFPELWPLAADAQDRSVAAIRRALESPDAPIRQFWILAEAEGHLQGIAHGIRLPVPPIYAGAFGAPGLIMEDCCVARNAPPGVMPILLEAAERELRRSGAEILLASSIAGGPWEATYAAHGYAPLTLYLARAELRAAKAHSAIRPATEGDVDQIVTASAVSRAVLHQLDPFWEPHADASARFDAWMRKSLTLPDRDMIVADADGAFAGYAIPALATPLHFPPPHDIARVGVIDDYHHRDLEVPGKISGDMSGAAHLLLAAEGALQKRGNTAALVVCPAAWTSKRMVLEAAGYRGALCWYIRRS